MQPTIRPEQLTVGTVIIYHLLPKDHPTHPERAWRGRIIKTLLSQGYRGDDVWRLIRLGVGQVDAM